MSVSSVSGKRYISANIAWGPVSHDKKRRAQASCSVLEMMKRNRKVGDTSLRLQGGLMGFQETTGRKKMKMDFRCSEGTSEDQRVRRGVGLRRCLQGKDREVLSAGSQQGWRPRQTEKEVAEGKGLRK